jgi:hypothetical protein
MRGPELSVTLQGLPDTFQEIPQAQYSCPALLRQIDA